MNNSYIRNENDILYRLELAACNIAIQALDCFNSLRTGVQRGVEMFTEHPLSMWIAGLAITGIFGMLSGFSFYCFLSFMR
jgi:hypothetical protein